MTTRVGSVFAAVLLLLGCGDDAAVSIDAAISGDAVLGSIDASSSEIDGSSSSIDASSNLADGAAGSIDAASGAGDATVGLGPVDCRNNGECPNISSCSVSAPGGLCTGCGTINDCPSGTDCNTDFGACIRDCNDDSDCNIAKRCTGLGRCAIRSCSVGNPCPGPYECVAARCARPMCGTGGSCPAPLTCGGTYCVEP